MSAIHLPLLDEDRRVGLTYAFGHLVASHNPEDPHHADSGEEGDDTLDRIGLTDREQQIVRILAEHVSGDYDYTGEGTALTRAIERGEV